MKKSFLSHLLLVLVVGCTLAGRASSQTLLDTFTTRTGSHVTSNTPRTYMGNSFTNNSLPAGTTSFQITNLTVFLLSGAAASYSELVYRVQFWNTVNSGGSPVFSNAAAPLLTVNLGPLTTAANSFYQFNITLTTPIDLVGGAGTNWGFVQNFQGNTGSGLMDNTNLSSLITSHSSGTYGAGQITTGTAPEYAWYRNASGRTDFNVVSTDARNFTGLNAQGIGIIISGTAVPEPATTTLLLMIGAVGGVVAWKRRQRQS